jgi:hypothetical protein
LGKHPPNLFTTWSNENEGERNVAIELPALECLPAGRWLLGLARRCRLDTARRLRGKSGDLAKGPERAFLMLSQLEGQELFGQEKVPDMNGMDLRRNLRSSAKTPEKAEKQGKL